MKLFSSKKGQLFDQLGALGIGVASLVIILVVAFMIMAQAKDNMKTNGYACDNGTTSSSYSWNATENKCCLTGAAACGTGNTTSTSMAFNSTRTLQTATDSIPQWVPIIIITAIGALLIGMVALFRR